jgi:Zn-dependent peptidase ImmA (M78 family)
MKTIDKRLEDPVHRAKEIKANKFAMHLLMPQKFLKEDIGGLDLTGEDIETKDKIRFLAQKYGVEESVMRMRLTMYYFDDEGRKDV